MSVDITVMIFMALIALELFITSIFNKWKDKSDIVITYVHIGIFSALFINILYELLERNQFSMVWKQLILLPAHYANVVLCLFFHNYAISWVEKSTVKVQKWVKPFILTLAGIEMILWTASLKTGWYFRINERGMYETGPYYLISQFMVYFPIIVDVFIIIKNHKKINKLFEVTFIINNTIFLMVIVIQTFLQTDFYIYASMIFFDILYYMTLNQNKDKEKVNLEKEMEEGKSKLLAAQIKPHFIYNILTTILFLCDEDISKTKYTIKCLSDYLRYNQIIMGDQDVVSFEEEKEHIRNYLELEKVRFEDKLSVKWDIQEFDFSLPALCVQPLVENAVKYGICNKPDGGTVIIKTRLQNEDIVISIIDDGIGFDPDHYLDDGKQHIGFLNVKQRVEILGNGKLEIESQKNIGTKAIIKLPIQSTKK